MKKTYLILIIILLNISCSKKRKIISVEKDNIILIIDYNENTSILDTNPLNINIKNKKGKKLHLKSLKIKGHIGSKDKTYIRKNGFDKSFSFLNNVDSVITNNGAYKLTQRFQIKFLNEISNLYIPNSEKYRFQHREEGILNNDSFFYISLILEYNNESTISSFKLPIRINSITNWSKSERIFIEQYKKYHNHWYASTYISSLINNKNILDNLSTETLIDCILNFKNKVNKETENYKYQLLTEIKKRNIDTYKNLTLLGHSKKEYFKKLLNEMMLGKEIFVPKDFRWDNEFFPVIIELHKQNKFKNYPKNILDENKEKWSKNKEYVKIYNLNFGDE